MLFWWVIIYFIFQILKNDKLLHVIKRFNTLIFYLLKLKKEGNEVLRAILCIRLFHCCIWIIFWNISFGILQQNFNLIEWGICNAIKGFLWKNFTCKILYSSGSLTTWLQLLNFLGNEFWPKKKKKIKSFKFVTKMTNFPKWLITLPLVKEPLIYSMAGKIESSSTLYLYSSVEIFKKCLTFEIKIMQKSI